MYDFFFIFFFFNDTATTEIYTLSLHDALPISGATLRYVVTASTTACNGRRRPYGVHDPRMTVTPARRARNSAASRLRSEEHTSELQSRQYLVCRLLLEKKKKHIIVINIYYQLP